MTEVQHLAKFWPVTVGLRDPRLLASPRKQVENDPRDSRPSSSQMNLDAGVLLQCLLEMFEDGAVRQTHDIHVVQEGREVFVGQQEVLKREQKRHVVRGRTTWA